MIIQILLFGAGALILIATFFDFFHTTLSGNGFGILSGAVNTGLSKLVMDKKSILNFKYSGLLHILGTTATWLLLLLLGVYLILISNDTMVVHSDSKLPADYVERFYYMCYVISTLGNGDFVPGNRISRIFTGLFSFSGFILLTTALTYFLSVVNAVLSKKQLALFISSMGANIEEIYEYLAPEDNTELLTENCTQLREQIIQSSSAYIFFPIMQYFLTKKRRTSVELQLARLNEVLIVVQNDFHPSNLNYKRVESLRKSIAYYLDLGLEEKDNYEFDREELEKQRLFWKRYNQTFVCDHKMDHNMNAAIKGAGWNWSDVYELNTSTHNF